MTATGLRREISSVLDSLSQPSRSPPAQGLRYNSSNVRKRFLIVKRRRAIFADHSAQLLPRLCRDGRESANGEDEGNEGRGGRVAPCTKQVPCKTAELLIVEFVLRRLLEKMLSEASVGRGLRRDGVSAQQMADAGCSIVFERSLRD